MYDRVAPLAFLGLMLTAAYRGQLALAFLATTLLVTLLITRFWGTHSLDGVLCYRTLSDDHAFPGDVVDLSLILENRKLLPLPWIQVSDQVPGSLRVYGAPAAGTPAAGRLKHATSLLWYQRVAWAHRLACNRRGVYSIGPAELQSSDPLGLFPSRLAAAEASSLVVYPRLVPLDSLPLPAGFPLGTQKPIRWIFEDPSRTVGARDYRPGDSLRRIHWKATARRQQLQTREFEPTVELEVALFLAVDTFPGPHSSDDCPFERGVSIVASVAHHLIGLGYPTGIYVNGGNGEGTIELAPASSEDQSIRILETLAGVQPTVSIASDVQITEIAPRLPWGTTAMVVAGSPNEALGEAIDALKQSGRRVELMTIIRGSGRTD